MRCKVCGWLLSDVAAHVAATYDDHTSYAPATAWTDRHGDVWTLGDDGMLHTPETAPFPREHVVKKWGPLVPNREVGSPDA